MVCLRNICINTLHKGNNDDDDDYYYYYYYNYYYYYYYYYYDDDDDDDDDNNNNNTVFIRVTEKQKEWQKKRLMIQDGQSGQEFEYKA